MVGDLAEGAVWVVSMCIVVVGYGGRIDGYLASIQPCGMTPWMADP